MTTAEFVQKMIDDEELRNAMNVYKTPEEVYDAAIKVGLTDDKETFLTSVAATQRALSGELTEEELEEIAGGASTGVVIAAALGPTVGLACVCLGF